MALDILIDEEKISLATLSIELERATISHAIPNESSLYVIEQGMFPFWVSLRASSRFVLLHSYSSFLPDLNHADRFEFCNRLNERLFLPSFHIYQVENDEDEADGEFRLVGNYPLFYRDGLLVSQFIRLCRQFSLGMQRIEAEFDPEHVRMKA